MTQAKLYILTGDVNTGKSTGLAAWSNQKLKQGKSVEGIVNPRINGLKMFVDVSTREQWDMIAQNDEDNPINVGNYSFSPKAFQMAQRRLEEIVKTNPDIIVIDEIGKLELKGQGLEPMLSRLIESCKVKNCTIVCAVRSSLLDIAISTYQLADARVISKEELNEI